MITKDQKLLFSRQARIIKALSHPIRLAIVDFLKEKEQCVCDIAQHVGAERSNVSRHLALLLSGGLVECRKEGLSVYYTLKTPCILNFLSCATAAIRQNVRHEMRVLENA